MMLMELHIRIKVEEVLVEKRSIMLWRDEIINIFFYFLIIDGFN